MINITRLYCREKTSGDAIRYGEISLKDGKRETPKSASERKPVVVWNVTKRCNLKCVHCYTNSKNKVASGELTTVEGKKLIDDLAELKVPALLLSGGEPLTRKDIFALADYASAKGVKCTLSTNGTLIDEPTSRKIKDAGFTYVGISLDGMEETNDLFRGRKGAFEKAMSGFRNCVEAGQKVGLRMTLTKHNFKNINGIFNFIEDENIDRVCFYHLAYSGRGKGISGHDLSHEETRETMEIILGRARDFANRGIYKDILTVDNHVDGVFLYLKLLQEGRKEHAQEVMKLLKWNGGGMNSSGVGIGEIDWEGNVHPDQFWLHYSFGNVRERKFSEIWYDTSDPVMAGLKDRRKLIKGKCSRCNWFDACGGSLRVRAEAVFGDIWAEDPACYLTQEEIKYI